VDDRQDGAEMTNIASGDRQDPVLHARTVAVISDLHLGSGVSILDEDGEMVRLVDFLSQHGVAVDAFVLNGDVCDFAMSTIRQTMTSAQRFVNLLAPLCREMIYIPGNHDHHSWLLANEIHEILFAIPDLPADCAQRTERMYQTTFLQRLLDDQRRQIKIAYPNVYWQPPESSRLTYLFHHGHFCEDLYQLVSNTLTAAFPDCGQRRDLEFLEATNFGWIELAWYQLGQMGHGLGANGLIENLYDQIKLRGPAALAAGFRRLYATRFRAVVHRALHDEADARWWLTEAMAERVADWLDRHLPDALIALISAYARQQQQTGQRAASPWRMQPLDHELARHCLAYVETSRTSRFVPADHAVRMVFGHTHIAGTWPREGPPVLFNDGGWVRGAGGAWPDAHVLTFDSAGTVTDLYFGERAADCRVTAVRST
jgi:hypothetical protein